MFERIAAILLLVAGAAVLAGWARRRRAASPGTPRVALGRPLGLMAWLAALALLGLALTGFLGVFLPGPLRGWLLLAHLLAGAFFMVAVVPPVVALAGLHAAPDGDASRWARAMFWLALWFTFSAILTVMLMMLQLFSTPGQLVLYQLHRWSALGLVVALLLRLAACGGRRGGTSAPPDCR